MALDIKREIDAFNLNEWVSFQGRIPRRTWWLRYVVTILAINLAIYLVVGLISAIDFTGIIAMILSLAAVVVGIALIWPGLAGYAKRLHDRNMSAWWILLVLIPGVGGLALLVICGFLKGTTGPNRYGPDPLGGGPMLATVEQATVIAPRR